MSNYSTKIAPNTTISLHITSWQRQQLGELGYSQDDIKTMLPDNAHDILRNADIPLTPPFSDSYSKRDAAIWYAKYMRWHIFPVWWANDNGSCGCGDSDCPHVGKHPIEEVVYHGKDDATNNLNIIDKWWKDYPNANIGLNCKLSNVIVVDIDPRKGDDTKWDLLVSEHGQIPETVEAESGGGGNHYFFNSVDGLDKSTVDGILIQRNGYIILAPSNHKSGGVYTWEVSSQPGDVEIADPPNWLVDLLRNGNNGQTENTVKFSTNGSSKPDLSKFKLRSSDVAIIKYGNPAPKGGRSEPDFSIVKTLLRKGATEDEIKAIFDHYAIGQNGKYAEKGKHGVMYLANTIKNARADIEKDIFGDLPATNNQSKASQNGSNPATPVNTRVPICNNGRHNEEISADAYAALLAHNNPPDLFTIGGKLSRIMKPHGVAEIQQIDANALGYYVDRKARFYTVSVNKKTGEKKHTKSSPTKQVLQDILAYPGYPGIPLLDGIVTAPVFSPAGTIQTKPGYDPKTRLFYHCEPINIGDITPTKENVKWAKSIIFDDILRDFPFDTDGASKTNAIALLLQPFVRPMIDGPMPMAAIESPTPGTGKGMLANVLTFPFNPAGPRLMAPGRDEDEWRKRITASLAGGHSHINFDNAKGKIESGPLAAVLTAKLWTDRVLGRSENVTLPNSATWILTGNNLSLDSELARRSMRIRLDSNVERPWERNGFKHPDLIEWMQNNRGEIVTAILTLINNWVANGMPKGKFRLGSFESWSTTIGGILDVNKIDGFMGNRQNFYDVADSTLQLWGEFIEIWHSWYGDVLVGTKDLFPIADSDTTYKGKDGIIHSGLGILDELLTSNSARTRKIQLGKLLADRTGQVMGNYKIVSMGTKKRAAQFKLQDIS